MQSSDGRDRKFVCVCGGDILHIRSLENGRKIYKCNKGNDERHTELLACVVCSLPKTVWADDGDVCASCGLMFLNKEITLTPEQIAGMEKWMVILKIQ